jgi:hypothetical protein
MCAASGPFKGASIVDISDLVPDCLPHEPAGVTWPASAQGL